MTATTEETLTITKRQPDGSFPDARTLAIQDGQSEIQASDGWHDLRTYALTGSGFYYKNGRIEQRPLYGSECPGGIWPTRATQKA